MNIIHHMHACIMQPLILTLITLPVQEHSYEILMNIFLLCNHCHEHSLI